MNWTIVSYYTNNYKSVAEEYLIPSVKRFELDYYIVEVPSLGDWKQNTGYKPTFIKQILQKINSNLVFIDVDAIINSYPELFDNIPQEFDIGIYSYSGELEGKHSTDKSKWGVLSGTLYIRNNLKIYNLIDKWISCIPNIRWEQTALDLAIGASYDIKVYNLPREYCYITSKPNGDLPNDPIEKPVISHFQKSRELRNK